MKLFYRKFGHGQPLIILHGLFGQSDNWNTLAKQFSENGFEVYTVDLRNHGLSCHSDTWDYNIMSDDIFELINDLKLQHVILLGHSMGGKVAMQFAIKHQEMLSKLIVVDIAPKGYSSTQEDVVEALNAVDFNVVKTRKEADAVLSEYLSDIGTRQFLLKNIYWKSDTELAWRFNLKAITEHIKNVGEVTPDTTSCNVPALFIRGLKSNYILDEDLNLIQKIFPVSTLESVADAGHWVHAEKPKEFFQCVMDYIKEL